MTRRVVVLVPAHNEAATIADCINSIKASDYSIEEIVVVADRCSDDTADIARSLGARVVETEFGDKAMAQNAVLDSIQGDVLVGFDADTEPKPDCISKMIEDLDRGNNATCATVLPIQPRGFFIRSRRFAYALGRRWWRVCQATVGRIQVLTGAAYAFELDAIKAIGGFPTGLISGDMPATWELHKAGYKLGYAGDAVALTYDPETFTVYRQQMRRWASGYWQTMIRHKGQLWHPKSMLVVWTAIFDLFAIFFAMGFLGWSAAQGRWHYLEIVALWMALHQIVTVGLVTSVVGFREAILGVVPYTLVNFLNKWWYFSAMIREVVLGKRYLTWTGRQGTAAEIGPMSRTRKLVFSVFGGGLVLGVGVARLLA